ncbi:MAG: hypothetical protein QOI73_2812, partial [Solirubrobacteraceae bacterium]|nr:hypothetical protein [Solirubrobacteraceae bacterium]
QREQTTDEFGDLLDNAYHDLGRE